MATILEEIADAARGRVQAAKARAPLEAIREQAQTAPAGGSFLKALSGPELAFICEIKKASPSKGLISPDFPYLQLAHQYENGGAAAISCLTEPQWFLGSDEIFREVHEEVKLPMLRKDFTVDPYQIYEAKLLGASAVLLICGLLSESQLASWLELTQELGMDALAEAHDADEIRKAAAAGARIIGVNNRNLHDFSVDFTNAARLRDEIPPHVLYVAESGVSTPEDVRILRKIGADAVLMGEVLMRAEDPQKLLWEMQDAD